MVPVGHVHRNQERWSGDKDKLKTPEPDVGDGEKLIIADILTARLENRHRHTECVTAGNRVLYSLIPTEIILQKLQPTVYITVFTAYL